MKIVERCRQHENISVNLMPYFVPNNDIFLSLMSASLESGIVFIAHGHDIGQQYRYYPEVKCSFIDSEFVVVSDTRRKKYIPQQQNLLQNIHNRLGSLICDCM
jgi:hypothetical protein